MAGRAWCRLLAGTHQSSLSPASSPHAPDRPSSPKLAKDTMQSACDGIYSSALSGPEGSWPMCSIDREHSALGGAVVFVAMELSKSAWLLASQGSPSGKTSSHRLEGGNMAGLLARCAGCKGASGRRAA